jgi:hypothetical protein
VEGALGYTTKDEGGQQRWGVGWGRGGRGGGRTFPLLMTSEWPLEKVEDPQKLWCYRRCWDWNKMGSREGEGVGLGYTLAAQVAQHARGFPHAHSVKKKRTCSLQTRGRFG